MHIKADFRIGKQSDNEWAGVYGYNPDEPEVYESFGEMFATVRMSTTVVDIDLEKVAKVMIDELQQYYFVSDDKYDSVLDRLEDAAWKMKAKMDFFLSREPELIKNGIDIEIAIAVVQNNYLYCLVIGESKIFVLRNGILAEVSKALIDKNMLGLFKSGSLEINSDDKLALASSKTIDDLDIFKKGLEELNIDDVLENATKTGASVMFIADESKNWKDKKEEVLPNNVIEEAPEFIPEESSTEVGTYNDLNQPKEKIADDDTIEIKEEPSNVESEFNEPEEDIREKDASVVPMMHSVEIAEFNEDDATVSQKSSPLQGILNALKSVKNKITNHLANNQTTYSSVLRKIAMLIKNFFKNISYLFKKEVLGMGRAKYVDAQRLKRNRIVFAGMVLVLILFIIFSVSSLSSSKKQKQKTQQDQILIQAFHTELSNLSDEVNEASASNLQQRTNLLTQFKTLEDDINSFLEDNEKDDEISTILTNLKVQKDILNLQTTITQPEVIADIGAQSPDSVLSDITFASSYIFVSDSAKNQIYRLGKDLNSGIEIHIKSLTQPYILIKNVDGQVIFYDKNEDSGIGKFDPETKDSAVRYPGLTKSSMGSVDAAALYEGNNGLYEIHKNNKQIFKRESVSDGYAGGGSLFDSASTSNWKVDNDFANATDIVVPYEIYTLIKGKGISRYLGGEDNTLSASSYLNFASSDYSSLTNASSIDVSANYMAVGDPANQRVLLFQVQSSADKKLQFIKQYKYEGDSTLFKSLQKLVIDEGTRQIYVLDGAKVIRLAY